MIWDAPRPIEKVSYKSLLVHWHGDGVVVGRDNVPLGWKIHTALCRMAPIGIPITLLALALFTFRRLLNRCPDQLSSVAQITTILGISVCACVVFHRFSAVGFNGAKIPMSIANSYKKSEYLPATYDQIATPDENVVIVDARTPRAFRLGHIPGAVNCPVDSSLGEYEESLSHINLDKSIIVYCANSHCGWDTVVANRLSRLGGNDIKIFEPGWMGWVETALHRRN